MGDTPQKLDPPIIGYLSSGRPVYQVSGGSGDPGEGGSTDDSTGSGSDDKGGTDDAASDKGGTDDGSDPKALQAEIDKWKALSRKHEGNAKANAEAAKKLKELEDADKSEVQKLNEQAEADRKRADEAEGRALRLEVGIEKGLTPGLAKRLVGSTREELEADADELVASMGTGDGKAKDGKPGGGVKEKLRGGGEPDDEPEENDPRKLAAKVPRPD